ncbi:hypothetical protein ACERK3_02965 [Phycisphaerales bacterium AB-hyl4]|uniref:PEP-CTERM protein-sorting domain-containing protein n=1 Tax=Natronomicrosphaera hydrolytica TaxID=3242702 RepID=A0ABV4U252_9BACT
MLLIAPGSAQAAWLSEVFLGGQSGLDMPNAIEISGLHGLSKVEMVIMDAGSTDRLGNVLQVVRFTATQPVHVIGDGDWPSVKWADVVIDPASDVTLDLGQLTNGKHTQLNIAGPRRIHVYEGWTELPQIGGNPLNPDYGSVQIGDAILRDAMTLAANGQAATPDEEHPVVDTNDGWVLVRPEGFDAKPTAKQWLVGSPDAEGILQSAYGKVKVTPGRENPHFDNIAVPAPQGIAVMLIGLGVLSMRRQSTRRRCT